MDPRGHSMENEASRAWTCETTVGLVYKSSDDEKKRSDSKDIWLNSRKLIGSQTNG